MSTTTLAIGYKDGQMEYKPSPLAYEPQIKITLNIKMVNDAIREAESAFDAKAHGLEGFEIKIGRACIWAGGWEGLNYRCGVGGSFEEAIKDLKTKLPNNEQRANALRDQARELLRQAAALENGGAK